MKSIRLILVDIQININLSNISITLTDNKTFYETKY